MSSIVPAPSGPASPLESDGSPEGIIEIGRWYWVQHADGEWLGCLMSIGSNYVEIHSPHTDKGHRSLRVHFDQVPAYLRYEPDPHGVITGFVDGHKAEVNQLMGEVQAITARLGFQSSGGALQDKSGGPGSALAVLSQEVDVAGYKRALVQAHDKTLPELFEKIKQANGNLAKWMAAETMPMQAMMAGMSGHLGAITDRVFNVTLYAGLTEEIVQCADGEPAAPGDKLHLMQRRLYMDEECLLGYRTGGMEFSDIGTFDAWLCEPENRDRILPFPRCLVALRVRRGEKDRAWDGRLSSIFVNFNLGKLDQLTFLYIRNGDQVYRLNCDLEFDEMIFPDREMFRPGEPMMVKMFARSVDKMITLREYEDRVREVEAKTRQYAEWAAQNPGVHDMRNPYSSWHSSFNPKEWEPYDRANVYYDECAKSIADKINRYNRVALIIQGLFDRSSVLHPHPPVKSWTADGFAAAIELVYDGSAVLYDGAAPDFEAYRAQCNDLIDKASVLYGQDDFWVQRETAKECARMDADWRNKAEWRPKAFRPRHNPGPGVLARAEAWQARAHKALFTWNRERLSLGDNWSGKRCGDLIRVTLTVPDSELFNVSAYTPGDFKRFFKDPRTRAEYLKWAPMLLTAEEYYAGNREVQEPLGAEPS